MVFSTGGHLPYSNGWYLWQRYGREFEFGIALYGDKWNVTFILVPGYWCHLFASWKADEGLKVYVDDTLFTNIHPQKRDYGGLEFDTFPYVTLGIDVNGRPHTPDSRFLVRKLFINNQSTPVTQPPTDVDELLWLGCLEGSFDGRETLILEVEAKETSLKKCRSYCSTRNFFITLMMGTSECTCGVLADLSSMSSDKSTCSSHGKWQTYVASCLVVNPSGDSTYVLNISIEKMNPRNYVKPNETVVIWIMPNFKVNLPYHVDFGDGNTSLISGNVVSYSWKTAGTFRIKISTNIGLVLVSAETTFKIEDVDEGTKPGPVMISGFHDKKSKFGLIDFIRMDYAKSKCKVILDDTLNEIVLQGLSAYVHNASYNQTYTNFGQYTLLSECTNPYGTTSNTSHFISRKFETSYHFHTLGTNFNTTVAGDDQFLNSITILQNGVSMQKNNTNALRTYTVLSKGMFLSENYMAYTANNIIIDKRILNVQNSIVQPSISSDILDAAWNLTTNVTVNIPAGNNMHINISFGIGENPMYYIDYAPNDIEIKFEVEFESLGYYPINVNVSNDISTNHTEDLVSVEVPIVNVFVKAQNITDYVDPVVFEIDLNTGSRGPMKVNFEINHDDGHLGIYTTFNREYSFGTYIHKYWFKDWGIYRVCVRAYNRISSVSQCLPVQVGEEITYIDLKSYSILRVTTMQSAEFNIRCPKGSDKTYIADFDDGSIFVFTDRYLKETQESEDWGITTDKYGSHMLTSRTQGNDNIGSFNKTSVRRKKREENGTHAMIVEENHTTSQTLLHDASVISGSNQNFVTTTTMQPMPVEYEEPDSTNTSTARRLRDGSVELTHNYLTQGVFTVKIRVKNWFNSAQDTSCTKVIVNNTDTSDCQVPVINVGNLASSLDNPLKRIRAAMINLTASVSITCQTPRQASYAWRAVRIVTEDQRSIERPLHAVCVDENTYPTLHIPAVSLEFGLYRITLTVAPLGRSVLASMVDFYVQVIPSPPVAKFKEEDQTWFFLYGSTIADFTQSRDPDFDTTEGLEFDIFCFRDEDQQKVSKLSFSEIKSASNVVKATVTYKYTTKNPLVLYQYGKCFSDKKNITSEILAPKGVLTFPSELFVSERSSFGFRMFVTKEGRTSDVMMMFEIRLSNATNLLDQLDDLLKSNDTSGVLRAVSYLTSSLSGSSSIKGKLLSALDTVSTGVQDVTQCDGMLTLVGALTEDTTEITESSRVKATSAIKNTAKVTEEFVDEPLNTMTDLGQKVVGGIANVLPTEDATAKLVEQRMEVRLAEQQAAAEEGHTTDYPPLTGSVNINQASNDMNTLGTTSTFEATTVATVLFTNQGSYNWVAIGSSEFLDSISSEDDDSTTGMMQYKELLKRCHVRDSDQLYRLYTYLGFYESIFTFVIKNQSEEIMINKDILKLRKDQIFCYLAISEEPDDIEWYLNRLIEQEKQRRALERKNADRDVSHLFLNAIGSISNSVLGKSEGNQTTSFQAKGIKVSMKKVDNTTGANGEAMEDDDGGIEMPPDVLGSTGNGSDVGQTMMINKNSPFTFGSNSGTVGTSVVTLQYSKPGSSEKVKVENTTTPIVIYLKGNGANDAEAGLYTLTVKRGDISGSLNYHTLNITNNNTSLHVIIHPEHDNERFEVFIKYADYPNDTNYDYMDVIPHQVEAFPDAKTETQRDLLRHTFFPPQNVTAMSGVYKIGIGIKEGQVDFGKPVTYFNYTFQMYTAGCRFWNAQKETWDASGCVVGPLTTYNKTQCLCTHLTSFGGDSAVPPNKIDFKNVWAKFKNLNDNAAVFSTVIAVLGLYILIIIWARYKDKQDLIKWGASLLEDNLPTDNYHYQVTVQTGVRKNAGTESNISFIISGEQMDTGVRRLFDGKRKRFETGSIMNFIMSTERCLGPLSFLRIWHDNTGNGKLRSWYLDQIQLTDLQTGERYFFIADRWLAVEEDDGMVDRIVPVAGMDDLVAFKQLFSSSVRKKLTNDHLWFSVFSRPTRSSFTRVQRISCCVSLLYLTMITNAMFFKSEDNIKNVQAIKFGPFSFTVQQLYISFISTIIVFPPSFVLITLFRKSRRRENAVFQRHQRMPKRGKWKNIANGSQVWGKAPQKSKFQQLKETVTEMFNFKQRAKYGTYEEEHLPGEIPQATIAGDPNAKKKKPKKKKSTKTLPFWCNYVAWGLCFLSITAPAFFTILYSMEWGAEKANQWLTTFLLSFFQSVIVVQPIKVLCLVAFIACVLKKPDIEEEEDTVQDLSAAISAHEDEILTRAESQTADIVNRRKLANAEIKPPDLEALGVARTNRLKEIQMETVIKEIAVYLFFVIILFFLSYHQRDSDSYIYSENLQSFLRNGFESIQTVSQYWDWLETTLLPALYVSTYYNGANIEAWWDKMCISDLEARRIGIARLRQMRIHNDSCIIQPSMGHLWHECRDDYNWMDDDTKPYLPGWQTPTEDQAVRLEMLDEVNPWVYQSALKLKNAPYVATVQTYKGGGYVFNFERSYRRTIRNVTRLRSEDWLDLNTRAVFLEFSVFNPNMNLFASIIMVQEFTAIGGAIPRSEFKIFRLHSYIGAYGVIVIIFEVIYCCFTLYFFYRCITKVKKEKCMYFFRFWNILEFVLMVFAVCVIAMSAFKHILTEISLNALKKSAKAEFVNFQSMAMYDELYGYMVAFVVFLASVQFLKLLQFNAKINMLGETVKLATKDLKVFSLAFLLYFLAFTLTGYLLFGQNLTAYTGFVQSAESIFAFTLGTFDFEGMQGAQKIFGPIFFFLFVFIVYVGLMSIFLTIIGDAFNEVRERTKEKENEYELMDFLWNRAKALLGVK
ncbi:hypothetical protein ACJMK2_035653 [Sinanodonta woodiana]|uniref:Polycystic kidney disease protein 1-like 2 n=1 Tax=Sinanodonta woodiana TaxID=1069815 RepID=A0ABD3WZ33_SINWO